VLDRLAEPDADDVRGHFGIRVERSRMGVGWPGQM